MKYIASLIVFCLLSFNANSQSWSRYYNVTADGESVDLFVPYKQGYLIGSNIFCSTTSWDGCTYLMYTDKYGNKIKDVTLSLKEGSSILMWLKDNYMAIDSNSFILNMDINDKTAIAYLDSNFQVVKTKELSDPDYFLNFCGLSKIENNRYLNFNVALPKQQGKYDAKIHIILTDSLFNQIKQFGLINENKYLQVFAPHIQQLDDGTFVTSFLGKYPSELNLDSGHNALIKFDTTGNTIWSKTIETHDISYTENIPSVIQLKNSNLVFTGEIKNFQSGQDLFPNYIQCMSLEGDFLWRTYFDYKTCECGKKIRGLKRMGNGDILGIGYGASFVTSDPQKGWIFCVSPEGAIKWERFYSYQNIDEYSYFNYVNLDNENNILIGSNILGGLWALKLDSLGCLTPDCSGSELITAVTEVKDGYKELKEVFFSVSPNPVSDVININYFSLQPEREVKFVLSNLTGIKLKELKANDAGGTHKMDSESLLPGNYFISMLLNGKVVQTEKIVKN